MDAEDVIRTCASSPDSLVIASHMEAVSHAHLDRAMLRQFLSELPYAAQVRIPKDGEIIEDFPPVVVKGHEQIASPKVIKDMQEMLRKVVSEGLGKKAGSDAFQIFRCLCADFVFGNPHLLGKVFWIWVVPVLLQVLP